MAVHEQNEGAEDPLVRSHLRQVSPLPAYQAEDWERLSERVLQAAEPVFAAEGTRPSRREDLVRLSRLVIPMAIAASVAALILLNRVEATATSEAAPVSAFLSAMAGETSRETVLDLTLGQTSQELLLADGR